MWYFSVDRLVKVLRGHSEIDNLYMIIAIRYSKLWKREMHDDRFRPKPLKRRICNEELKIMANTKKRFFFIEILIIYFLFLFVFCVN